MLTIRSARAAAEYFKAQDAETGISESMIRGLMDQGILPVVNVGSKRLTSIEAIESWLESQLGGSLNEG